MKITKQRLKEIIKEELLERLDPRDRDELVSRVKRLLLHSAIDEEGLAALTRLVHDLEKQYPIPERKPRRGEVQFFEEAEEKHDHQAALKVVSRDGKKKGVKVSGTWKSGKIKVKWMGVEGIHAVDRPDYTRKNW